MTERKPAGVSWESWIDRQIREGMDRGDFDGLPGHGKPLDDLDRPRDEMWWVKSKLQRETVDYLPPTLKLRKEVEIARERIAASDSEAEVRQLVGELNAKIRKVNSGATDGPPSTLLPLDVERVVDEWMLGR